MVNRVADQGAPTIFTDQGHGTKFQRLSKRPKIKAKGDDEEHAPKRLVWVIRGMLPAIGSTATPACSAQFRLISFVKAHSKLRYRNNYGSPDVSSRTMPVIQTRYENDDMTAEVDPVAK